MSDYYDPNEENDLKSRFEVTIPLLLLILILFVLAWRFGWLAGIPLVGDLLGGKTVNIAIIGEDPDITLALESDARKYLSVNYRVFASDELFNARGTGEDNPFSGYNMMIITEGGAENDYPTRKLNWWTYEQINEFASGNPVMVIMQAATGVEGDIYGNGWSRLGFVPVQCTVPGQCTTKSKGWQQDAKLVTAFPQTHPMLNKVDWPIYFEQKNNLVEFVEIIPKPAATTLINIEYRLGEAPDEQYPTVPVIVEGSGNLANYLYFAFHPRHRPSVLTEALRYLGNI